MCVRATFDLDYLRQRGTKKEICNILVLFGRGIFSDRIYTSMGTLLRPSYPDYILLGIEDVVQSYRNRLDELDLRSGVYEPEIFTTLFDSLITIGACEEDLAASIDYLCDQYMQHQSEQLALNFKNLLISLANAIYYRLQFLKIYSEDGLLWYEFSQIGLKDVVLKRVTKEHFIN